MLTEQQVEEIDEIATEYISWCFEAEGRVPWLSDTDRAAVRLALKTPDAERRYQAVLDVIETIVDNIAATEVLKGGSNH